MMRSLFSGVAGLKTHQTKMDVIGNNISNVNTVAYKSSSIVFADLMSQTTQRASGANENRGGINARQIGLGVKSAAINMNITGQGSAQSTGNPFDLMLTGENFFVVSDGISNYFTRDGSFYVDGAGNLAMTSNGYNVMGWGVDPDTQGTTIKKDTVTALRIMSTANLTYPPEATSQGTIAGIIDKNDTDVTSKGGKAINFNFYDSLGYSYTAKIVFKKSDSENGNEYSIELDKLLDSNGDEVDISNASFGGVTHQNLATTVKYNTDDYQWTSATLLQTTGTNPTTVADLGWATTAANWDDLSQPVANGATMTRQESLDALAKVYGYEGSTDEFLSLAVQQTVTSTTTPPVTTTTWVTVKDMLAAGNAGTASTTNPNLAGQNGVVEFDGREYTGSSITFHPKTGYFDGLAGGAANVTTMQMDLSGVGPSFTNITLDFSDVVLFDNKGTSTVGADRGDPTGLIGTGRRVGDMIGVSIQNDGKIYANYDSGMTKLLGQIATASFPNASGLEKHGENLYTSTLNSGDFDGIGVDVTANGGSISTGQLEMSNVDLSTEFTEMITTQRGFQANSRIITVSDTLLEELTNLKR
ncbi:MAG: flagellar hook-basal body complex protein [Candidatus Gastranaerophilales bacterium]|nr:flagellar hook-basal body complex protein [Candidatus Gastranaerophilales bacterium]